MKRNKRPPRWRQRLKDLADSLFPPPPEPAVLPVPADTRRQPKRDKSK